MDIGRIAYRKLFNLGNYENEAIEVEAWVQPGQSPGEVLQQLREWVEQQHTIREDIEDVQETAASSSELDREGNAERRYMADVGEAWEHGPSAYGAPERMRGPELDDLPF